MEQTLCLYSNEGCGMKDIQNSEQIQTVGSSLSGKIYTTYDQLVEAFGAPTFMDYNPDEKIQVEWVLLIDGIVATIYNWKLGYVPYDLYDWHIGGFNKGEVEAVQAALNIYKEECLS